MHQAVVPPILAPQKPASLAHHEVTAAGGSSIIEFAGAAQRRPKTCPNATRNARARSRARAFRSHSPANLEFPRPCRRPRRGAHHEHQRDPPRRRRRVGGSRGPPIKASPLRLRQARPRPQKGPAALTDLMAAANAADPKKEAVSEVQDYRVAVRSTRTLSPEPA